MIRVGVVGYGYWGPNIVRNFRGLDGTRVDMVCDKSPASVERVRRAYADVATTTEPMDVIKCPSLDAVAIITPVWTHYELAKAALENGKHVFVEKPFTSTSEQAEELIELAEKKKLTIMVDHTFLYTGAVRKIDSLISEGTLGDLYYYDSMRVNLGLFQHDINVIWDLAPHDLSIMDYLIKERPEAISATGQAHFDSGLEDVAFITVYFPKNIIAHINVNWLSPVKVRTTLIGGEKKMLVWNDLEADEKIKVYDKGVDIPKREAVYQLLVSYRSGDMFAPRLPGGEALTMEMKKFIDCINTGASSFNDGHAGLRIVKLLEAAQKSIKNRGELVYLDGVHKTVAAGTAR
ncbi:MAG: Gfo/Idh/MocA family protein [Terriglobales bacterium]